MNLTAIFTAAAVLFFALPADARYFTPPADSPAPQRAASGATRVKSGDRVTLWVCAGGLGCEDWQNLGSYYRPDAEKISNIYSRLGYRISIR